MDNSINFKGAFLVKPTSYANKNNFNPIHEVQETLTPLLEKSKKQIIHNVTSNGDILYVVSNSSDKQVAEKLLSIKHINLRYYPTLSTKSGFKNNAVDAKRILRSAADKVINTKEKLLNYIASKIKPIDYAAYKRNIDVIMNAVFPNSLKNDYIASFNHSNGICTVYTMTTNPVTNTRRKHTLINITPPGKDGISYARYSPIIQNNGDMRMPSSDQSTRRFALKSGKILFEYTEPGSSDFKYNEEAAIAYYINKNK